MDASHLDEFAPWSAQPNDLIGGAIVTTLPLPMSEHDHRKDGDPAKRGYVIAECMTMADAGTIADLLNGAGITRRLPHSDRFVADEDV
jgi:hypothetical protein